MTHYTSSVTIPGAHECDSLHGQSHIVIILVLSVVMHCTIHHLMSPGLEEKETQ